MVLDPFFACMRIRIGVLSGSESVTIFEIMVPDPCQRIRIRHTGYKTRG